MRLSANGLWDSADYEVEASLWQDGHQLRKARLAFATAPGGFAGVLPLPASGRYTLVLFGRNTVTGSFGVGTDRSPGALISTVRKEAFAAMILFWALLIAFATVGLCVIVHYEALRLTSLLIPRLTIPPRPKVLVVIAAVFSLTWPRS